MMMTIIIIIIITLNDDDENNSNDNDNDEVDDDGFIVDRKRRFPAHFRFCDFMRRVVLNFPRTSPNCASPIFRVTPSFQNLEFLKYYHL